MVLYDEYARRRSLSYQWDCALFQLETAHVYNFRASLYEEQQIQYAGCQDRL